MGDFLDGLKGAVSGASDTVKDTVGDLQGTVKEATEAAGKIAKTPGYGSVFTVDAGGFRLTNTGHLILGGFAVYGLIQLMSR